MKKTVLKGWVVVTGKEGRLSTYDMSGFYMFDLKRDAECYTLNTGKVVKVKVTIEPA